MQTLLNHISVSGQTAIPDKADLSEISTGKPVIACNSGGPRESIVQGVTGLLCEPQPAAFAAAMRILLARPS